MSDESPLSFLCAEAQRRRLPHRPFDISDFPLRGDGSADMVADSDAVALCEEYHDLMYRWEADESNPRGVCRMTTSPHWRAALPAWETLFGLDDIDPGGDSRLVALAHCPQNPHRVLLFLAAKNAEETRMTEFDLARRLIPADAFRLPESRFMPVWRDENTLFASTGGELLLWRRGEDRRVARSLLRARPGEKIAAWRCPDFRGSDRDIVLVAGAESRRYFGLDGELRLIPLPCPPGAELCALHAGRLLLFLRREANLGGRTHAAGSLVAAGGTGAHKIAVETMFAPGKNRLLRGMLPSRHFVLLHIEEDFAGTLKLLRYERGKFIETEAPTLPARRLRLIDRPGGDVFLILNGDESRAPVLYSFDAKKNEVTVLRRQKAG